MTLYEMTEAARQLKALLEADEIDEQTFSARSFAVLNRSISDFLAVISASYSLMI